MPETTNIMRQVASSLSYNGKPAEAQAKHFLLAAASELDHLSTERNIRNNTKPPLGLMPKHVWKYKRSLEVMRAIIRYDDAGLTTNVEWHEELRGLITESNPADQRAASAPVDPVVGQTKFNEVIK